MGADVASAADDAAVVVFVADVPAVSASDAVSAVAASAVAASAVAASAVAAVSAVAFAAWIVRAVLPI